MRPTRRTQPYRRGARTPGPALSAMMRGGAHGAPKPPSGIRGKMAARAKQRRKRARRRY